MKNTGGMHIYTQIYINLTFKNIPLVFCRNPKKLDCLYIQKNLTEVMKYKRVLKGLSRVLNIVKDLHIRLSIIQLESVHFWDQIHRKSVHGTKLLALTVL